MDPAVEPELLSAARRGDQQGGNPLFRINPQRIGSLGVFATGRQRNMLFVFVWSNCERAMVHFKEKRCLRPLDKVWFSLLRTIKLVLWKIIRYGCPFITAPVPIRGPVVHLSPLQIG